ncbi:MAG: hypothetical protein FJX56_11705 [Alphaproteobacteria bacterium]|nr:hypothetical protein [Alphaproteobacteria bacterium]
MATLTIRNLDDQVVHDLKTRAKAHNRSLEAEVRDILAAAVHPMAPRDLRALAERVAALTPEDVTQTDSVVLLREDRGR